MTGTTTPLEVEEPLALGNDRRDLTALDRCDVCGARAWVRAVMKTSELLFCAHHGTAHLAALTATALFVQDDSHLVPA